MPVSSQPPPRVSTNVIENEDLAWECFGEAMKDKDINVCYDMSLRILSTRVFMIFLRYVTVLLPCLYYFIFFSFSSN